MGASLDELAELRELMSHISEERWSAGWLVGLEFILWDALQNDGALPGPDHRLPPEHVSELRRLSQEVGGWIWFESHDEAPPEVLARLNTGRGEMFVSLALWAPMFAKYKSDPR